MFAFIWYIQTPLCFVLSALAGFVQPYTQTSCYLASSPPIHSFERYLPSAYYIPCSQLHYCNLQCTNNEGYSVYIIMEMEDAQWVHCSILWFEWDYWNYWRNISSHLSSKLSSKVPNILDICCPLCFWVKLGKLSPKQPGISASSAGWHCGDRDNDSLIFFF